MTPRQPVGPFSLAFFFINSVKTHRHLILQLIRRDIAARYRGSVAGILWSFFNPLMLLAVYTFAFNVVFKVRWSAASTNRFEFAIALFIGLMIFNFFSECVNKSSTLITSNPNYVKKLLFPLEILPLVAIGSAAVQFAISFAIWFVFYCLLIGLPSLTIFQFPLLLLPLFFLLLGASLILSSIGTYFRDLPHIVGLAVTMLMFLSPIFYSIEAVPADYRGLVYANPLAQIIEESRKALILNQFVDPTVWLVMTVVTLGIAYLGLFLFQRLRVGFADVV